MQFELRATSDDQVSVVEIKPIVIGTFPDQEMARKVMVFLNEDAKAELSGNLSHEGPTEVVTQPAEVDPAPKAPNTKAPPKKQPKAKKSKKKLAKTPDADAWTDDELDDAFVRLIQGEKLTDVAKDFGKSWTKLRGKWAGTKNTRQTKMAKSTEQKTARAPLRDDQEACRVCDRPFVPSVAHPDLCGRCA